MLGQILKVILELDDGEIKCLIKISANRKIVLSWINVARILQYNIKKPLRQCPLLYKHGLMVLKLEYGYFRKIF